MDCEKCGKCCVNVPITVEEYQHIVEQFPGIASAAIDYGFAVEIHGPCPLLAPDHSCTAYELRARVCRMFPVVVTGKDENGFTMGPSDYCPRATTVSSADIEQAKELRQEYNAEMAKNWQEYQQTHPDAASMALHFLASRSPLEMQDEKISEGSNSTTESRHDTLVTVIQDYEATLGRRKKKGLKT
ncbi:MAG TPA: YkgJ family cysteine cluster protein [Candidatus Lokiarchaeia archaeon]|nr:YkgJ family cysteine cluster protein [Candidatus Lokiarchaeia archaeon]